MFARMESNVTSSYIIKIHEMLVFSVARLLHACKNKSRY
jgi:hypothetical protein